MQSKPIYHLLKALRSQGAQECEHRADAIHLHPHAPMPGTVKGKPARQGLQCQGTCNLTKNNLVTYQLADFLFTLQNLREGTRTMKVSGGTVFSLGSLPLSEGVFVGGEI